MAGAGEDLRRDRIQGNDTEYVQSDLNGRAAALHLSGWRAFFLFVVREEDCFMLLLCVNEEA